MSSEDSYVATYNTLKESILDFNQNRNEPLCCTFKQDFLNILDIKHDEFECESYIKAVVKKNSHDEIDKKSICYNCLTYAFHWSLLREKLGNNVENVKLNLDLENSKEEKEVFFCSKGYILYMKCNDKDYLPIRTRNGVVAADIIVKDRIELHYNATVSPFIDDERVMKFDGIDLFLTEMNSFVFIKEGKEGSFSEFVEML